MKVKTYAIEVKRVSYIDYLIPADSEEEARALALQYAREDYFDGDYTINSCHEDNEATEN
jgi:hypothetical protein